MRSKQKKEQTNICSNCNYYSGKEIKPVTDSIVFPITTGLIILIGCYLLEIPVSLVAFLLAIYALFASQ